MRRPTDDLERRLGDITIVLMDIDGTLVTSSQTTFTNVSTQLRRLKRLGVHFSLATGRTISGAMPILDRLRASVSRRMAPMINYNGGVVLSAQDLTLVERHVLPTAGLNTALLTCRSVGLWPIVYTCRHGVSGAPIESVFIEEGTPPAAEFNGMRCERVSNLLDVTEDVVAVLADAGDVETSARLSLELSGKVGDGVRVSTSGSRYLEICSPNSTKLNAMRRMASFTGVGLHQIMAIGDNLNDLDMISAAGVGVAVNNAPVEVKKVASYVCDRDSAEGVVEALRLLARVLSLGGRASVGDSDWQPNESNRVTYRPSTPVIS